MSDEMVLVGYDELKKDGENAWLLLIGEDEIWFPKSRCEIDEQAQVIEVPEWLAEKECLIGR